MSVWIPPAHCLSSKALGDNGKDTVCSLKVNNNADLYEASLAQIGSRLQPWRFHSVEERSPIGFCKCIGYAHPLVSQ